MSMGDEAQAIDALILAAFRQACRQGEPGVAEHLLCALEALAAGGEASTSASVSLDEACLSLRDEIGGAARTYSAGGRWPRRTR
ncbi:hypothetical protein ACFQE0_20170 [Methylobacterium komagatae]|uniref:Uncharacterized protein n=1 Tax=Methylobacterium komagatae TaxID=374425 RepID=A0ABW2BNN6_9HYPH|nr:MULTISPECIES: hypothetical protein [Methylobacterium]MBY0254497.1 hypothetical protein [Methylobacterium organophilum]MDE3747870.1 hypothetical protein [Methylobacterium radiotolerans]PVZ05207.1 hypothetical protein C7388_105201 [Methylobacterium organophilum]